MSEVRDVKEDIMRKPAWIKFHMHITQDYGHVRNVLSKYRLSTVCAEAKCPNRGKCYSDGTATFLILGDICTRACRYCSVRKGMPQPLDPNEPLRVALASKELGLSFVVITSVTRDDLPDGGAHHYAETVRKVKEITGAKVEVLIPDFKGNMELVDIVMEAQPDVMNHNVEVVPRLFRNIRPGANYQQSLDILRYVKDHYPNAVVKSGFMVGLGENKDEVFKVLKDLYYAGVDIVTIGQYLRPSKQQIPVHRYVTPEEFKEYEEYGMSIGIPVVVSGPLVRSSYKAKESYEIIMKKRGDHYETGKIYAAAN